jgi:hypothetical protein
MTRLIELVGIHKSYNLGLPNEAEVLHGVSFASTAASSSRLSARRARARARCSTLSACSNA